MRKFAAALAEFHDDGVQMDLLNDIKQKRARQREKQPIKRDAFNQVSWIVRHHGLDENFLKILDQAANDLFKDDYKPARVRMKARMKSPLFSLATYEEYSYTMSIISKVDNPYLKHANSPEEILLCRHLYQLNPAVPEERLMRFHFETLVLHERSKVNADELDGKVLDP